MAVNLRHNTSWFLSCFKAAIFTDLTRTVPDITVSRNACFSCFKNALLAIQWTHEGRFCKMKENNECYYERTLSPKNTKISKLKSIFHVSCTVHCNIIIQYKPTKCIFSKLKFICFFNFLCLLHVSNPMVHLQEDGCIYSYGTVRFTCIGISSLVGRLFRLLY